MKIQLVAYNFNEKSIVDRTKLCAEIFSNTSADLLFMPGHTLLDSKDVRKLFIKFQGKLEPTVFLEARTFSYGWLKNVGYIMDKEKLTSNYSPQFFASSSDINNNEELAEAFVNEVESRRIIIFNKLQILELRCGEQNILKNQQKNNNKVVFRIENREDLTQRFKKVLNETNIVFNPTHTPMGNQGKLHKRREYFSANNRVYVTTTNVKKTLTIDKFETRKLQYVYQNGTELKGELIHLNRRYLIREFDI